MPVIFRKTTATLQGLCTIEDVEPLLQWLAAHPGGKVQMKNCENLHSAVLQTLLAGQAKCSGWPTHPTLCAWLKSALQTQGMPGKDIDKP